MNATSVAPTSLSADRNSSTSVAAPDRLPQAPSGALSVTTDRAPRIVRTPRPYHAGACLVICEDRHLSRPCNSLAAAKRYVALLAGTVA